MAFMEVFPAAFLRRSRPVLRSGAHLDDGHDVQQIHQVKRCGVSVAQGGSSLGLAEELLADVPQVVAAVHEARVGSGQLARAGPVPGFLSSSA